MKTAVVDCVGGASGNMLLGALIDAGLDRAALERELHRLPLQTDWRLDVSRVERQGLAATHVEVQYAPQHEHRRLPDIARIVRGGALPEPVAARSLDVFTRLADAEAQVHGIGRDDVHFHEVGAVDAIIDIVGLVLGLYRSDVAHLHFGPLPVGTGPIRCAHGTMPNPAPATAALLRGVPLHFTEVAGELVTPTGAALLVTLGTSARPPALRVERIGYGAGTRDSVGLPNVTRLLVGEAEISDTDDVVQVDTNLDDMNPQLFEFLMEKLFDDGALDVFFTPIQMKKNRPAILLSVLCKPGMEERVADLLLRETTTLGVRMQRMRRRTLAREVRTVQTSLGAVRVKFAANTHVQPEYDDCRRLARELGLPLRTVMDRVRDEASHLTGPGSSGG